MLKKETRILIIVFVVVAVLSVIAFLVAWLYGNSQTVTKPIKPLKSPKLLITSTPNLGMFSQLFTVLQGLRIADEKGWRPVVVLNSGPYLESRPHLLPSGEDENLPPEAARNWFLLFFNSVGSPESVDKYSKYLGKLPLYRDKIRSSSHLIEFNYHSLDQSAGNFFDYASLVPLWKKYIRIKQFILETSRRFVETVSADGVYLLGVHFRGTNKNHLEKNKRNIPYREMYNQISACISKKKQQIQNFSPVVFVATDEQPFLGYLKQKNLPFVSTVALRSQINTSRKKYKDNFESTHLGQKPYSGFEKGKEVMVDFCVLARCDEVLGTRSFLTKILKVSNPGIRIIEIES